MIDELKTNSDPEKIDLLNRYSRSDNFCGTWGQFGIDIRQRGNTALMLAYLEILMDECFFTFDFLMGDNPTEEIKAKATELYPVKLLQSQNDRLVRALENVLACCSFDHPIIEEAETLLTEIKKGQG